MVSNDPGLMFSYQLETRNQMLTNTTYLKIPNFQAFLNQNTIPEFRTKVAAPESTGSRFQIKIKFQGRNNDLMQLYFLSTDPVFMKYTLSVAHGYSCDWRSVIVKEYQTVQPTRWHYIKTFMKCEIERDTSTFLFGHYNFALKFSFTINTDVRNLAVNHSNVPGVMTNDVEVFFNNGCFSDVTILSAEQIEYKVHKVVLASRSAVLKAHFEHNTTECLTNIVESPFESEVVKEVLTFIYSDKSPRVDDIPEKLLAAADYYQLNRLKSLCEEALHKKLTVENAVETFQLADMHSANTLKELILEFIQDGHAKMITMTKGWAKLDSVVLIKIMYTYLADFDPDKTAKTIHYCDCDLKENKE